jgi:DNA replication and repair protein RecF
LLREATISAPPGTAATEPDSGPRTAATRAGGGRALWLAQLTLANFRSYARMSLEVDPRPVVLTGPNGAGKTNVLEAISFLSPGRGLRGARLGEVVRRHEAAPAAENADDGPPDGGWSVAARVVTPDGPRDVGTGRENGAEAGGDPAAPEARERRLVKIDGAFARGQQTLAEVVRLVWLTPRMDGLFREGAGARRRFLDRLVTGFDPGHAGRLAAYEQALRQRARLLRSGGADDAWLTALEDTMARHGVAVAAARRALIGDLSRACALGVGPFPRAGVALLGDIDDWLDALPALGVEDELRTRLAAGRGQDAESGGAAVGPHRSDLAVHDLETGRPGLDGRAEGHDVVDRAGPRPPGRSRKRRAPAAAAGRGGGPSRRGAPRGPVRGDPGPGRPGLAHGHRRRPLRRPGRGRATLPRGRRPHTAGGLTGSQW